MFSLNETWGYTLLVRVFPCFLIVGLSSGVTTAYWKKHASELLPENGSSVSTTVENRDNNDIALLKVLLKNLDKEISGINNAGMAQTEYEVKVIGLGEAADTTMQILHVGADTYFIYAEGEGSHITVVLNLDKKAGKNRLYIKGEDIAILLGKNDAPSSPLSRMFQGWSVASMHNDIVEFSKPMNPIKLTPPEFSMPIGSLKNSGKTSTQDVAKSSKDEATHPNDSTPQANMPVAKVQVETEKPVSPKPSTKEPTEHRDNAPPQQKDITPPTAPTQPPVQQQNPHDSSQDDSNETAGF